VQLGQLLRPYPQFLNITANQVAAGHSSYHATQIAVERRFSRGLGVLFSYTHSKIIDNVGEIGAWVGTANGISE